MLSNSSTVTNSVGRALPTSEKNETIQDTLANKIGKANTRINEIDAKFAGLKHPISLGENYVMNCTDFTSTGFYHIGSLAKNPTGNVPENNCGDYNVIAISTNYAYQVLIALTPRDAARMYIGYFWDRRFTGWRTIYTDEPRG